ncbi:MAG: RNA 3'-terminal phosphate cyclase [Pseudomonadota bacterium]
MGSSPTRAARYGPVAQRTERVIVSPPLVAGTLRRKTAPMVKMLDIDGSYGEGGGQVLRTSLSLSVALRRPIRLTKIRAGRPKPGLMRQHLTCVRAAAEISGAKVEGDHIGSTEITFRPGAVEAGDYTFRVGTAGSAMLVLQTVAPPLLLAGASTIQVEGGTHNPSAPPWELIDRAWMPAVRKMGGEISGRLERYGFMPAGGGRAVILIGKGAPCPIQMLERGEMIERSAEAIFANLPVSIAERELKKVSQRMSLADSHLHLREVKSNGPGNAVIVSLTHSQGTEVVAEFGTKQRSAENVATQVSKDAEVFMAMNAPVGRYLADQLLVSMALMAGGRIRTFRPTRHTVTNKDIINRFVPDTVVFHGSDTEKEIEVVRIAREQT